MQNVNVCCHWVENVGWRPNQTLINSRQPPTERGAQFTGANTMAASQRVSQTFSQPASPILHLLSLWLRLFWAFFAFVFVFVVVCGLQFRMLPTVALKGTDGRIWNANMFVAARLAHIYHTPYTIHHTSDTTLHIPYSIHRMPHTIPYIHIYVRHIYRMLCIIEYATATPSPPHAPPCLSICVWLCQRRSVAARSSDLCIPQIHWISQKRKRKTEKKTRIKKKKNIDEWQA